MSRRVIHSLTLGALATVLVLVTKHSTAYPPPEKKEAPPPEAVSAPVPQPVKIAPSRVAAVTVYPNSALVTREVDVPEGAGTLELTVTPLPPMTVNSSLYT